MKKLLLFSFLLSGPMYAQDTIVTQSGEKIIALVKNISPNEIEYKKAANPDGPSYISVKKDVFAIYYSNGTRDVFGAAKPAEDYYGAAPAGSAPAAASTFMNMSHVKNAVEVVFYGIDFSSFYLVEPKRMDEGQKIRDVHFPEWNTYLAKEAPEKTLARWLRKRSVVSDNSVVAKLNAQVDPMKVVVASHAYSNMYERIKSSIAQYAALDSRQQGIGLVMHVEYFDRRKTETSAYFTFFDIATHAIISSERVTVKNASGAGLTNFWGITLIEALRDYVDKKYKYL